MDNNNDQEPDFMGALEAEFGLTPQDGGDTDKGEDTQAEAKGGTQPEQSTDSSESTEQKVESLTEADATQNEQSQQSDVDKKNESQEATKTETAEEKANREGVEATTDTEPKYATAEDVKQAMREMAQETSQRVEQVHTAKNQIIEALYPEGIDKNIYDTDGNVLKTAQDIVDKGLINSKTNEPYTYEEAASFMLEANRKMTENIEELNTWAEQVAEQNVSLIESNQRVMSKWGDILKAMPGKAQELAERYITTQLTFDKTGNYITNMSMSPEDFYELTLTPYLKLGEALVQKQQLEEQNQNKEQQAEQDERNGTPPQRGTSDVKANTGDPMLDALVDELNKG